MALFAFDRTKLGANVSRFRKDRGLTLARLAELSGVTQAYISQIEAGSRPGLGVDIILSLASVFRVSLDEMVGFDLAAIPEPVYSVAPTTGTERFDRLEQMVSQLAQTVADDLRLRSEQERAQSHTPAQKAAVSGQRKKAVRKKR